MPQCPLRLRSEQGFVYGLEFMDSFAAHCGVELVYAGVMYEGEAPQMIIGTRPDGTFSRPQCVYPKLAQYSGGPKDEASSFACQ